MPFVGGATEPIAPVLSRLFLEIGSQETPMFMRLFVVFLSD
jgi:hypothetical protein